MTGQLEHPNIVPVYEVGRSDNGTLYYTMKLVRGRTLARALQDCQGLGELLADAEMSAGLKLEGFSLVPR